MEKTLLDRRDYTVKELAELAGVNPSRIRQILNEDNSPLKGEKRGGAWFIPARVARAWLESRQQ